MLPVACGLLCAAATALAAAQALRAQWPALQPRRLGALGSEALARVAARNERVVPAGVLRRLDRWLRLAGRPLDLTAPRLLAAMEACALLSAAAGAALSLCLPLGTTALILFPLLGAACPLLWLRDRIRTRTQSIVRSLPWAVDLLTLSVEAGLDFTAALAKVVEKGRRGPLADELSVAIKELRLGKTREEALRNLARRAGVGALSSFVQALAQADRMGTPLGKVLRILSTQMRVERTQRAEKLANEAPVKLLLPLILFIFPTLFLVLFGPIGYQVFLGGSF
jgi:tight adherence protein C